MKYIFHNRRWKWSKSS